MTRHYISIAASALARALLTILALIGSLQAAETVIYVSKFYEVRPHDAPTKYVWDGETRVARVSGQLSATQETRIQKLRLFRGWNLCSIALSSTNLFPTPEVEQAHLWDPASKRWQQLEPGAPIAAASVLWIHASEPKTVALLGTLPANLTSSILAGGDFATAFGSEPLPLPAALSESAMWSFDASQQVWRTELPFTRSSESLPFLSPGEPLFIQSAQTIELAAPAGDLQVRYYHQDHLGSSSVITDARGALVEETAYHPFGVSRNQLGTRTPPESYLFTQKERDKESRLHYFESRFFSAGLSRFLTADEKFLNLETFSKQQRDAVLREPQKLNIYSYVQNNPLNFVDPSGQQRIKPPKKEAQPLRSAPVVLELSGFDKSVDVDSLQFSQFHQLNVNSATTSQEDRDIIITQKLSPTAMRIMELATKGETIESAEISFRKPGGATQPYLKVKLKDVVISSYMTSKGGDQKAFVTYTISAAEVTVEHVPQAEVPFGPQTKPVR